MKADLSRFRFDRDKNYTSVIAQQGRVQLDADANEQRAIDEYLRATGLIDVVGRTGAPKHAAGFAITVPANGGNISIGPGRFYVDGLLCEAAQQTDYMQQRWLIGPQPSAAALLSDLRLGRSGAVEVWLEAWQRIVTPIDDPGIKDVALGEADTTDRLQTVFRVVAEAAPVTKINPGSVVRAAETLRQNLAVLRLATESDAVQPVETEAATLAAQIARSGLDGPQLARRLSALHASTSAVLARTRTAPESAAANAAVDEIGRLTAALQLSCCDTMRLRQSAAIAGRMTVSTDDASGQGTCLPAPHAAYRGLENQLYRIEVHHGGPIGSATFKWSRDNGSVLTRITDVSGPVVTVDDLGPDANLGFAPLQWVEIADDADEFGQQPNQPGELRQIQFVDQEHRRITLTAPAPAVNTATGHAKLRRWDQASDDATANGVAMNPAGPNALENGINVRFAADQPFRNGDYWLVAARTATGMPEWPPTDSNGAEYQPARFTRVRRAPLACIHFDVERRRFSVEDCRAIFSPLTELLPPAIPQALHVSAISWANDDVLSLDQLLFQGLTVTLDGPPAATIDAASFIVVLQIPFATGQEGFALAGAAIAQTPSIIRIELVLDGSVSVSGDILAWSLGRNVFAYLAQLTDGLASLADTGQFVRARVTLKGRTIRDAAGTLFLDGQAFGAAATRRDGATPRTTLTLPSGNQEKASDFESWFYVAPIQQIQSMTITPARVAFVVVPGLPRPTIKLVDATSGQPNPSLPAVVPVLSLTLNYNSLANTTLALSVSGGTTGIVQVPASVTIPRGSDSPAQPIQLTIRNPGPVTQTYTITATLTLPSGQRVSSNATIIVTGVTPPGPIITTGPVLTPGPIVSRGIAGSGATPTAGSAAPG